MSVFDLLTDEVCEPVQVDGKPFYIRYLTALERDRFEEQWQGYKPSESITGIRAFMVAFCLCDSAGKPEFDSGDKSRPSKEFIQSVVKIGGIPATKLQPLFSKAMEINGFSSDDVEELEKKS